MDSLFFLNESNYGIYNRQLATLIGLVPSAILSELIQKRQYHFSKNQLIDHPKHGEGWFYHTIDSIQDRLGLSREEQNTAIKRLLEKDLIELKVFGIPASRHFRIKDDNVLALFGIYKINRFDDNSSPNKPLVNSKNLSSLRESHKLDCVNPTNHSVGLPQTRQIYKNSKKEHKDIIKQSTFVDSKAASAAATIVAPKKTIFSSSSKKANGKSSKEVPKNNDPPKDSHGSYVTLSQEEYQTFCQKHGKDSVDYMIDKMNDFCASSKPKGYKDYAAALRNWFRNENLKGKSHASVKQNIRDKQFQEWKEAIGGQVSNPANTFDYSECTVPKKKTVDRQST